MSNAWIKLAVPAPDQGVAALEDLAFADASRASWFMFGAGGHTVWIDPDSQAVIVVRWLDGAHSAGFVRRVAQALRR